MPHSLTIVITLAIAFAAYAAPYPHDFGLPAPAAAPDGVLVSPQRLGNPFTDKPVYSRNVWDMKAFGNKIYFGHGDWGDNTGPIPFRYFDTISRQFLTDFVLHASNTACQTADGRKIGRAHV